MGPVIINGASSGSRSFGSPDDMPFQTIRHLLALAILILAAAAPAVAWAQGRAGPAPDWSPSSAR